MAQGNATTNATVTAQQAGDILRKALFELLKEQVNAGDLDQKTAGGKLLELTAQSAAHAIMGTIEDVAVAAAENGMSRDELMQVLEDYTQKVREYWEQEMARAIKALGGDKFAEILRQRGVNPKDIDRIMGAAK